MTGSRAALQDFYDEINAYRVQAAHSIKQHRRMIVVRMNAVPDLVAGSQRVCRADRIVTTKLVSARIRGIMVRKSCGEVTTAAGVKRWIQQIKHE